MSLAESNELLSLELSWAWEPTCKNRTWRFNSGSSSLNCFLSKTQADKEKLDRLKYKIKCAGLFVVHNQDRGGGLALLWQKRVSIWVGSFSKFHIDALINGGTNEV